MVGRWHLHERRKVAVQGSREQRKVEIALLKYSRVALQDPSVGWRRLKKKK